MKTCLSILFVLLLSLFGVAQTPTETPKSSLEKDAKLIDLLLSSTRSMSLPENRAIAFARIGSVLWERDEKQARKLFADAIDELIVAPNDVGLNKKVIENQQHLLIGQSPRRDILEIIARFDVQLALDSLYSTRPAKLSEYLLDADAEADQRLKSFLHEERNFEQRLKVEAAMNDPDFAAKRLRESFKQGVSPDALDLIDKIAKKDPKLAQSVAEEALATLAAFDYRNDRQAVYTAMGFLSAFDRVEGNGEKGFAVSAERYRELVSKLLDYWSTFPAEGAEQLASARSIIEKHFPSRVATLMAKYAEAKSLWQTPADQELAAVYDSSSTGRAIANDVGSLSKANRKRVLEFAANKAGEEGDDRFGEEILSKLLAEKDPDSVATAYYSALVSTLTEAGRFTDARRFANRIPDESARVNALINIAEVMFAKNPEENRKLAETILDEASYSRTSSPESKTDLSTQIKITNAWAEVDHTRAFQLIGPVLAASLELTEAEFKIMKYNETGKFRRNELLVTARPPKLLYGIDSALRRLAAKDEAKTLDIINSVNRNEIRVWLLLEIIDSGYESGRPLTIFSLSEMFRLC